MMNMAAGTQRGGGWFNHGHVIKIINWQERKRISGGGINSSYHNCNLGNYGFSKFLQHLRVE